MAFSKEYNEDRGHVNSLYDVRNTDRVNEKTPGTCYSCKSSDNPRLWAEMGMAEYDKTPFADLGQQINNPIGCANCHDANTMRLVVTNPALEEALAAQGKDWKTFTAKRCARWCAPTAMSSITLRAMAISDLPVDKGHHRNQIDAYDVAGFKDWEYPDTATLMIKMQQRYEMYTADSTLLGGVARADCHMPYTRDGAAKFSTHDEESARQSGLCVWRVPHGRELRHEP